MLIVIPLYTCQACGALVFVDGIIKAWLVGMNNAGKDASGAAIAKGILACVDDMNIDAIVKKLPLKEHLTGQTYDGALILDNTPYHLRELVGIATSKLVFNDVESKFNGSVAALSVWCTAAWDGAHKEELAIGDVRADKGGYRQHDLAKNLNDVDWCATTYNLSEIHKYCSAVHHITSHLHCVTIQCISLCHIPSNLFELHSIFKLDVALHSIA